MRRGRWARRVIRAPKRPITSPGTRSVLSSSMDSLHSSSALAHRPRNLLQIEPPEPLKYTRRHCARYRQSLSRTAQVSTRAHPRERPSRRWALFMRRIRWFRSITQKGSRILRSIAISIWGNESGIEYGMICRATSFFNRFPISLVFNFCYPTIENCAYPI